MLTREGERASDIRGYCGVTGGTMTKAELVEACENACDAPSFVGDGVDGEYEAPRLVKFGDLDTLMLSAE